MMLGESVNYEWELQSCSCKKEINTFHKAFEFENGPDFGKVIIAQKEE